MNKHKLDKLASELSSRVPLRGISQDLRKRLPFLAKCFLTNADYWYMQAFYSCSPPTIRAVYSRFGEAYKSMGKPEVDSEERYNFRDNLRKSADASSQFKSGVDLS